jgi:hypothetical protein
MELDDRMEGVLPRMIEVEPPAENSHDLGLGRMCHLPDKPAFQLDFEVVGGTSDRIGKALQDDLQLTWDDKAALIASEHKLNGHKLNGVPRRNRPRENGKRPFAPGPSRQDGLERLALRRRCPLINSVAVPWPS